MLPEAAVQGHSFSLHGRTLSQEDILQNRFCSNYVMSAAITSPVKFSKIVFPV